MNFLAHDGVTHNSISEAVLHVWENTVKNRYFVVGVIIFAVATTVAILLRRSSVHRKT